MYSGYRYLVGLNGYPLSAAAAVLLHLLALGFILYWNSGSDSSELELVQPTVIKALFIDENPQTRERIERQRQQQIDRQRQQQEAQRQREAEAQRQRDAEAEAERRRQLEQQRLLDAAERQRLLEAERQRQAEQERAEREQEEQRQRELAQQRQRELDAAERARQREEAQAAAARTEFEVVQSGVALIQQFVQEVWSRPPSARNGMRAVLRINMLPTGEVTDVAIIESSGDAAFDRSAENAVYRAQPFREMEQMPTRIFNANFRTLSLIFQPEDLLN